MIIGAVRVVANNIIDVGSDISVANTNTGSVNTVEIRIQPADFTFIILVGRKNLNECGIWGQISTNIAGDTPMSAAIDVGCLFDGLPLTLTPSAAITLEATQGPEWDGIGTFVPLLPKLGIEWDNNLGLSISGETYPPSPPAST